VKTLVLVGSLFLLLAACDLTRYSVAPTSLSPGLSHPCEYPVTLPDRALLQWEVEDYWLEDRSNLLICRRRHQAIVESITGENNAD
jgi:hypothetical protein